MKKILLALILGLVFFPVPATAQKWVDPYVRNDGTFVEGHWENPKDSWQKKYSKPGAVNSLTGQFNTYYSRDHLTPPHPTSRVRNPSDIPGSSDPNPYAVPGSSPKPNAPNTQGSYGSKR